MSRSHLAPLPARIRLLWPVILSTSILFTDQSAPAQTLTTLYSFQGGQDGANPAAGLVIDKQGNLFGTTYNGGAANLGTVFEVSSNGSEVILHSFQGGQDGANPGAALVPGDGGDLFGTTINGGPSGAGTVFKLTSTGIETVLYSFTGSPDGANPPAELVRDQQGNLFGTTFIGGEKRCGTVFEIGPTGVEQVLYSFKGAPGCLPRTGLVRDKWGNLYGTTSDLGHCNIIWPCISLPPTCIIGEWYCGGGTIFEITPKGAKVRLYEFQYPTIYPASLILGEKGTLYGTTIGLLPYGGTLFELTRHHTLKVIYQFYPPAGGMFPKVGLLAGKGVFYGTVREGGSYGDGAVFAVTLAGEETLLYSFTGGTDGAYPFSTLARDKEGNLYGTTWQGGAFGYGTVFKLTP